MSYYSDQLSVVVYVNERNDSPFTLWLSYLDDFTVQRINTAINRILDGNMSNCKNLSKGLWEIKLTFGAGIRVYFGRKANNIVLLWGGIKQNQSFDIARAHKYWIRYLHTEEHIEWH